MRILGPGLIAAISLACSPTEPCACPPVPPGSATLYGTAVFESAPIAGAEVVVIPLEQDCTTGRANSWLQDPARTDATGAYKMTVYEWASAICVRAGLVAEMFAPDTIWSAPIVAELAFGNQESFSYRIDFVIGPESDK